MRLIPGIISLYKLMYEALAITGPNPREHSTVT